MGYTNKEYDRTKRGVLSRIYRKQKQSSKRRGHREPEYSRKEFEEWLFSQTLFHVLFDEWKQSGFKHHLKPSVDRKINSVHYCFGNIQLMTWDENRRKEYKRDFFQHTLSGEFIAKYTSVGEASRATGIKANNIGENCAGRNSTAGGFIWSWERIDG